MANNSGKTAKDKPSEKSPKTAGKSAPKGKKKPKPIGDGEGPSKF